MKKKRNLESQARQLCHPIFDREFLRPRWIVPPTANRRILNCKCVWRINPAPATTKIKKKKKKKSYHLHVHGDDVYLLHIVPSHYLTPSESSVRNRSRSVDGAELASFPDSKTNRLEMISTTGCLRSAMEISTEPPRARRLAVLIETTRTPGARVKIRHRKVVHR